MNFELKASLIITTICFAVFIGFGLVAIAS
ncbi:cytochrome bd-I oxidase subunit CydH [Vibrio porteresiae]|uniref:YnhF family membrane protein n=1 Tax=Vibrio porteresiae DSM 19223 TaxID=1123496 RepID=A0ABZ0QHK4_9VIBR|nr:YnhF family membrane protein [Vibrio porteresiae]WPC74990.1 YnhF family membrane protein [Vibrio porteresiae DSM 19223]